MKTEIFLEYKHRWQCGMIVSDINLGLRRLNNKKIESYRNVSIIFSLFFVFYPTNFYLNNSQAITNYIFINNYIFWRCILEK